MLPSPATTSSSHHAGFRLRISTICRCHIFYEFSGRGVKVDDGAIDVPLRDGLNLKPQHAHSLQMRCVQGFFLCLSGTHNQSLPYLMVGIQPFDQAYHLLPFCSHTAVPQSSIEIDQSGQGGIDRRQFAMKQARKQLHISRRDLCH